MQLPCSMVISGYFDTKEFLGVLKMIGQSQLLGGSSPVVRVLQFFNSTEEFIVFVRAASLWIFSQILDPIAEQAGGAWSCEMNNFFPICHLTLANSIFRDFSLLQ